MTRKRFVKLVMSCGYSRNFANATASYVNCKGLSYAVGYDDFKSKNNITVEIDWQAFAERAAQAAEFLGNAIADLSNMVQAAAVASNAAFLAFSEAYRAELEKA